MKVAFLVVAVFFLAFYAALFVHELRKPIVFAKPPAAGVVPSNSVFHKPTNANCPHGTTLLRGFFLEEGGARVDACHNPKGDGSIDYLNPGEGCAFGVQLEEPPTPAAKKL